MTSRLDSSGFELSLRNRDLEVATDLENVIESESEVQNNWFTYFGLISDESECLEGGESVGKEIRVLEGEGETILHEVTGGGQSVDSQSGGGQGSEVII